MVTNKTVTATYPENSTRGFMVCGYNYGYSKTDEKSERLTRAKPIDAPSFFSDMTVRRTDRFRAHILTWLESWGLDFIKEPGKERAFERSFFQCNWLDTQTHDVAGVSTDTLVTYADGFLGLVAQRRPAEIFFFGSNLIEALNDERVRPRAIRILGERRNPDRLTAELPSYTGTKFKVLVQKFGQTTIISSPHPQTRGLSDAYMAAIKLPEFALREPKTRCFGQ